MYDLHIYIYNDKYNRNSDKQDTVEGSNVERCLDGDDEECDKKSMSSGDNIEKVLIITHV